MGDCDNMCYQCEMRVSEYCKHCADIETALKFGDNKVHPSDSPRQSPDPPSSNCIYGRNLQAVTVRHSTARSDEDEAEDSAKSCFSPYSLDNSDVDSSSVSTRHDFNSFMSLGSSPSDSPSRIQITSYRLRNGVHLDDQGTPRSSNDALFDQEHVAVLKGHDQGIYDDFSIFNERCEKSRKPLDFETNDRIWFPPPPADDNKDADNNFFSYAEDDDDEMGDSSCAFSSCGSLMTNSPRKDKPNEEQQETLITVVQGHFRALVSQLLQSEFNSTEKWLDIITSLAWEAANYVKPDTSRGGSMDPGDYVKIKCIASGSPTESTFIKGVVCTKNIKHKRMTSQYKNARLLILGGALEYQRSRHELSSIETLLQQEMDHLKMVV